MNVATRGHAQSSLQASGEIGDDVPEHIIGHDDVELARVAHHLHAERVHVHVFGLDLRIFTAHFFEYSLPQAPGVSHGVRLVAHEHPFAMAAVELCRAFRILKCVADYAFHSFTGIDILLHCDLIQRAFLKYSTRIGVSAFGIFADHNEVDVLGFDAFERAQRGIEQAHRTHVGIEIHFEAHAQQDFFGVNVRGDARIAKGTYEDRVEVTLQHSETFRRDGDTVCKVTVGTPVKLRDFDVRARSGNDLDRFGDYFFPDAVSRNNGDSLLQSHGRKGNTVSARFASEWRTRNFQITVPLEFRVVA